MSNEAIMTTPKKKDGRGKPPGSRDVQEVKLGVLLKHGMNENTVIPIRRKWLVQFCKFNNIELSNFDEKPQLVKEEASDEKAATIRDRVVVEEENLD